MTPETAPDELREEYEFDYSKAKPNRFASRNKSQNKEALGVQQLLEEIKTSLAALVKDREIAEAQADSINHTIEQVAKSGLINKNQQIIGNLIHMEDIKQSNLINYYFSGVLIEQGVGAFIHLGEWGGQVNFSKMPDFLPFKSCPAIVQSRLAGEFDALLGRVLRGLTTIKST